MEGLLLSNPAYSEVSVLRGAGSRQVFPGSSWPHLPTTRCCGQAAWASSRTSLPAIVILAALEFHANRFDPVTKQPLHTSLVRVFLCKERMESGRGIGRREGERLAPPLPKWHRRAAMHWMPGLDDSFEEWLTHSMGSGSVHLECVIPTATAEGKRKYNRKDAVLHPACTCLWKKFSRCHLRPTLYEKSLVISRFPVWNALYFPTVQLSVCHNALPSLHVVLWVLLFCFL